MCDLGITCIQQVLVRPNKKNKCVSGIGLKILGRVGTHFFLWKKNIILCILKGIPPFKMHKIIFFFLKT